ncbi:uncharacterized protein G6M90_00g050260 [Metarhizium brunneum]|uniref:Uncharacterized protein n=1 Tax=Metarhizium brunneum TaxID=500148 RepID=A0A7D5UU39_9HYPO|nr:hypothetical protein G6M90_00g050260 [Metarhizium brunneum]
MSEYGPSATGTSLVRKPASAPPSAGGTEPSARSRFPRPSISLPISRTDPARLLTRSIRGSVQNHAHDLYR